MEQSSTATPDLTPVNRLALMSDRTDPFGRPRRRKVAILGFTDHRLQAPFTDPDFEIWGLNELYRYMDPRQFTRWFEIHPREWFTTADPEHLKSLAQFPLPVYMHEHYDDIPPSVPFPKEAVERSAGVYMTSSIAWMLGLALLEGFEEIHVYGVDMAQDTEYFEQRACCEYLLGIAKGRGVKVYVPPTSDLLKAVGQYGWSDENPFRLKIDERIGWLERELAAHQQRGTALDTEFQTKDSGLKAEYESKRAVILQNVHQIQGAIDDSKYYRRSWTVAAEAKPGAAPHPERSLPKLTALPAAIPAGDGA